uniref:Uncharacterized protein n=1 Tax=Kalanchoe fedtschenkoi TaxID=63787 RepID=A0A7N0T8L3_KALFE
MNNEENEAASYAMVMAELPTFIHFMKAALELNLFQIISEYDEPVSALQLSSHLPKHNPQKTPALLGRMLRLFAAFSLLTCTLKTSDDAAAAAATPLYSLSRAGKYFVKNKDGGSFASLFIQHSEPVIQQAWHNLKDAVLEGVSPSYKAYGLEIFQVMSQHPKTSKLFNQAMTEMTTVRLKMLLQTYKGFVGIKSLVDIGGGSGTCLESIISVHPHIKGINFDLQHVIEKAPPIPGVVHVAGNMFVSIPKGDAVMLKNVLHNWADEECLKIIRNCYDATPPEKGKVIVVEVILPTMPTGIDAKHACLLDSLMFISPGGKERTREEYVALSKGGGFSEVEFVCCFGGVWVMEFHK